MEGGAFESSTGSQSEDQDFAKDDGRKQPQDMAERSSNEIDQDTESDVANFPSTTPKAPPTRAAMYLLLTNISKRTNVRSLLMTCAAFGCRAVFVAGQRKFDFDPDGPDVPNALRTHIKSGYMRIERFDKLNECVARIRSLAPVSFIDDGESVKITDKADKITERIKQDGEAKHSPVRIVGVEIDETSLDVESTPFVGDTVFMMGNEGQGLSLKQKSVCDGFVKISQYGNGTASLNVNVAASIVLHRFHLWSRGYDVGGTL